MNISFPLAGPIFTNPAYPPDLDLLRSIALAISSPKKEHLPGQLEELAAVIGGLPKVRGAIVVALEERSVPLASGAFRLGLASESSMLEALAGLQEALGSKLSEDRWIPVPPGLLSAPASCQTLALPIGAPERSGLILIALELLDEAVLGTLKECSVILAAAIQSAIRTEAWSRIERLQWLARHTFREADWNLKKLPHELAEVFRSDAVTILLQEHDELRLAASTDPSLGEERPVVYRRGEGLTGAIFASGKALRLSDTQDAGEILRVAGSQRMAPLHPERDSEGVCFAGQFLGVPMRFGGNIVGVVRMCRRGDLARFTLEDQTALQFFADLLGAALAPSWGLLLNRGVLDSISDAVAVSRYERDEHGRPVPRIVMANAGAARLLGREAEEIVGRNAREIYAPGEYEKIRQHLANSLSDAKIAGRSETSPVPSKVRRSDGTPVSVMISYRILANHLVSPPSLYTVGLARDTSRSEHLAEQHQRILELLDTIGLVYFQADQDGKTLDPNQTESRITGYSVEELKRLSRAELYPDPNLRTALLNKVRKQGGRSIRELQQMRRKDGTLFWIEGDLRIVKDSEGRESGIEGLYRDVTDRIQLQGFLNEGHKRVLGDDELFAKLKADAEFHLDYLMSLGHQLQTPLGALIETLRNFEAGVTSQNQLLERLPYAIGQALVCTRLVRNLSFMDKILRGEPFQRERVPLAKLAIETKLDFLHLLKDKKLELVIDDESLRRHLNVQGHREMLRQVLVNLVDNAIKYSLPSTVIHIRARVWPEGPALEISNQGFPISDKDRERIFQRGFRTRQAQALIPHGTGLGLWLVRKIVEAHEASIRCQEVLEDGGSKRTLFRITFPHSNLGTRRHS